jgi:hypothetical protein
MPEDTPPPPPGCPVAARIGALLRTLSAEGMGAEVAQAEALALLLCLRPAVPLPMLREEAARIAAELAGRGEHRA